MINFLDSLSVGKRNLFITLSIILIFFGIAFTIRNLFFSEEEGEIEKRSKKQYSAISTEYLGKYLSEKYPKSKAVIFYDSLSTSPVFEERLNGLRKGLQGSIDIYLEIPLPKSVPQNIPPRMIRAIDYISAEDFNIVMKKYPNVNMIISLVGLPHDSAKMNIWQIDDPIKRPKFILFGGNLRELSPAIEAGYINALVLYRHMDKSVNELPPADIEEAFNRRFRLITPESVKKDQTSR